MRNEPRGRSLWFISVTNREEYDIINLSIIILFILVRFHMRSEEEIRKRLLDEIDTYLTCPKFSVEEHAHNISMLAWVVDVTDKELSDMIRDAENSFT